LTSNLGLIDLILSGAIYKIKDPFHNIPDHFGDVKEYLDVWKPWFKVEV